jgi:uncharacterized protein
MNSSIRYRVVIDTNVVISALVYGGVPLQILELVRSKKVRMLLSPELEKEIVRKFYEFSQSPEMDTILLNLIELYGQKLVPHTSIHKSRDPKDDMLLALSLAGRADFLITGDKDLLVMRTFDKTHIVTPRIFLEIVKKGRV